jgi:Ca-activated chloride channel homolog
MGRIRFCLWLLLVTLVFSSVIEGQTPTQDNAGDMADPERQHAVIPLTAVDRDGRPVSTLRPEDLRVVADGVEHRIVAFSRRADEPLRVAFMLDASASQEKVLPAARAAASELLSSLLRPGAEDSAAVISFTNKPTLAQDLTGDVPALRRAVEGVRFVPPPGYVGRGIIVGTPPPASLSPGSTAIWDALAYACDEVLARSRPAGHRAVILITDGNDTSSHMKLEGAAEHAIRAGVAVYSVGVGDADFDGVIKGDLRKLSERTGGRAFFPRKMTALASALGQIRQELLSQYAVTFVPRLARPDGTLHKLRVEVANPELRRQGVELTYPQGFFVGDSPAAKK